jgi:ABC-type cobalamin transport system permease subunit
MSAESGWAGIAVGASVGTLAWVVGLGNFLWPQHPNWALSFITLFVAVVSMMILERTDHAANSPSKD